MFVTSGQQCGSVDLAGARCVVFPGWRGKSHTNSFCVGFSVSPGVARWVWLGPGSLFAGGGLTHGASSRKRLSGIPNVWGGRIRASSVEALEDQGCSSLIILQIATEVSPTPWPFMLKVNRCLLRQQGWAPGLPPHFLPFPAAKAGERHHHRGVVASAFPHGGGAEDLQ